jgi:hypothetical protein
MFCSVLFCYVMLCYVTLRYFTLCYFGGFEEEEFGFLEELGGPHGLGRVGIT